MGLIFGIYNLALLTIVSLIYRNVSILIIGLIGFVILYISFKGLPSSRYRELMIIETIAVFFMILVYIGLNEMFQEPYYGNDDKLFERYGYRLYADGIFKFKDIPYIQGMFYAKGYLVLIAWIQKISSFFDGYSTMTPRVLNMYLWMSIVVLTIKSISKKIENEKLLRRIFICLGVFPNALYIMSFVYRDVFIAFLIVVSIYNLELIIEAVREKNGSLFSFVRIALVATCLYALFYSRMQMLYVVLLIFIFCVFEKVLQKKSKYRIATLTIAICVAFIIFQALGGMELLSVMGDNYSNVRLIQAEGLSKSIFALPILPIGFIARSVYGLICPFPGALFSLEYFNKPLYSLIIVLTNIGTIFQMFLLPYLYKAVKKVDYSAIRFLLIYLSIILTTFTFRHFVMIYPFGAMILAEELQNTPFDKKKKYSIYIFLFLLVAAAAYLLLKL